MRILRRPATDDGLLRLLEEAGRNVERAGVLLRDLVRDYPEHQALADDLVACEHEGDRLTHDIIRRLGSARRGLRGLSIADGHALATALDDIVDFAEESADAFTLFAVEAPMEQAVALTEVLVATTEQVSCALVALRAGGDPAPHLVEIQRLEAEGDRLERDGLASLFAGGIDPMVVIRWKDIFEKLEASVDACETVAHLLEGIALRAARR